MPGNRIVYEDKIKNDIKLLISEVWLDKRIEAGNGKSSAVVVIVENGGGELQRYAKKLRFRGALKA